MMISNRSKRLAAAAFLSTGLAFASHTLAQEAEQPAPQPTQPAIEAPDVSDEKLRSFAVAFVEVEKIKQEYAQRLQAASSESEQQQVQNEAGEKMLQAVENTGGISVNEYNEIIQAAQVDSELAQRLTDAIGQASQ